MKIIKHRLSGVVEILPSIFRDNRGYFVESFNLSEFKTAMEDHYEGDFVQDNQSFSKKGVLRGLHIQKSPHAQGKLVRVITGKVLDVLVDFREKSPTYGQHLKIPLDSSSQNMVYVPKGFLHGFVALEDSIFCYKCNAPYSKEAETGVIWDDPTLAIDWEIDSPTISVRDLALKSVLELNSTS